MNKPESLCDSCDNYVRCLLNYDGPACRRNRTTQPTNADRIRAMTNEELAEWICTIECSPEENCAMRDCRECVLEWLKKEVNNG